MTKKVAVLGRDRQEEALRMAIGIILLDDVIDVYIRDHQFEESGSIPLYMENIVDMEMNAFSNVKENKGVEYLSTEEIARQLLDYDHVLPY